MQLQTAQAVLTDVRITKDGVFVVNHNDEAKFVDGTELLVAEATYEELSAKPLLNTKSDEVVYICTFQRYLEICRDAHMVCFIELKGDFTDEQINELFTMADEIYDLSMCCKRQYLPQLLPCFRRGLHRIRCVRWIKTKAPVQFYSSCAGFFNSF